MNYIISKSIIDKYNCMILIATILMFFRSFIGTELTDEAYYISDAIAIMNGNVLYAYNNFSLGSGAAIIMIPFIFIYSFLVDDNEGIVLFLRLCYVVIWCGILTYSYTVIKRASDAERAKLFILLLIPFNAGLGIFNFSYNNSPAIMSFMAGILLYDVFELAGTKGIIKSCCSGFLMGLSLFTHPGYFIAIVVFTCIMFVRCYQDKTKIKYFGSFYISLFCIISFIFLLLTYEVGWECLYNGVWWMFHPYPVREISSNAIYIDRMVARWQQMNLKVLGAAIIALLIAVVFFANNKIYKNYFFSIVLVLVAMASVSMYRESYHQWRYGAIGILLFLCLFAHKAYKDYPLILYVGLSQVIFCLANIFYVDLLNFPKLGAALPAFAVALFVLCGVAPNKRKILNIVVLLCCSMMLFSNYHYVYRDNFAFSDCIFVQNGVYKGVLTSSARANDLPQLEMKLNNIISEAESYAFRDNAPAAYLMLHHGTMLSPATWDVLNYGRTDRFDMPANLYNYYKRRNAIPNKIIYVDMGINKDLSIENNYKYNEFVNEYYKVSEKFSIGSTVKRVIVYEYQGGFNDDYDYWINKHKLH